MGDAIDEMIAAAHSSGWEDPVPFGYGNTKLPVFPAHRLPPWLNEYVVAVAHELQVPVDLPGMLALTVLAAAAGGRAVVEVQPKWREPLNLYTATAMHPGSRKTPVFMRLIRPLEEAEEHAIEAAKPGIAEARVKFSTAKARAEKAEDEAARASTEARDEAEHYAARMRLEAEAVTVPHLPRLLADDATPETLVSLMAEQGGRLALFSDEGEVFSIMQGRYSSSGPNLGVFLKAHVGSPIRVDRKSRDAEIIKRPALTMGMTIQPDMLADISAIPGARGRGLIGRFLWALPPSNIGSRKIGAAPVPDEVEDRFLAEITALILSLNDWTDPAVLVFSDDAWKQLERFQIEVESRMGDGGDLAYIADWAAKLVGHVVRIAGLLHLATNVRTGYKQDVSGQVVADAINIGHYLIAHAKAAFFTMGADSTVASAQAAVEWIKTREEFSQRDFYKAHQRKFGKVAKAIPVLDLLVDHGFIRLRPHERGQRAGRPAGPRYVVNPRIRRETEKGASTTPETPSDQDI